ncbi:hypothetical protein HUT29_17735 [Pseudomonas chlororaphis]|uniref:hypothetical protein n=1 Tax=Pseudomonas chlororaphis TaxID=587753 RepID=UPI001B30DCE1|nr:hypothetical protein [Pseudomonas chlororaphis]QTT83057.1 hypothetical protein HUT29_17735 [Pseudomonas chlororaphis]
MELKVGEFLDSLSSAQTFREDELDRLLRSNGIKGKLVDYLLREGDQITLVECKAVEPTDLMKCTSDAETLNKILKPNYIKAIHQGQAVANALSSLDEFKGCSFRLLVVTYGDHFVFGGEYIADNIDLNLVGEISKLYTELPIPMRRISYLSLQDFAGLVHGLKENERLLGGFLDAACDAQLDPQTRCMTLAQVVEKEIGVVPGSFSAGLGEEMDRKSEALQGLILENSRYWRGKVEHFLEQHASLTKALNPSYTDVCVR